MTPEEKACSRCKEIQPAEQFYLHKTSRTGLSSQCRTCCRERARAHQLDHPEQAAARKRAWYEKNRERMLANANEWAANNRERSREIKTAWRLANPETVKRVNRAYYDKNTDKVKQSSKSWRERNPERWATILKLNQRKREARRKQLPAYTITAKDARRILSSPCAVDGCAATDIQFDHVIPIARGGSHGIGNLQPLCGHHNASKNDKTWMEFRIYLRRTCEMRTA